MENINLENAGNINSEILNEKDNSDEIIENAQHPIAVAIENVLNDTLSPDEFLNMVISNKEELTYLRQEFNATISAEKKEVQEFCKDAIYIVDLCFENFFKVMDELSKSGASFDKKFLEEMPRKVNEAHMNLNMAFIAFRNEALIARGPSGYFGINLIINDIQSIIHFKEIPEEELLQTSKETGIEPSIKDLYDELGRDMNMEISLAEMSLETLKEAEPDFFNDSYISFFKNYIDTLKIYLSRVKNQEEMTDEMLLELQGKLEKSGNFYSQIDIPFQMKTMSKKPTVLPTVNLVINSGERLLRGWGEIPVFQYFLDELWHLINATKNNYQAFISRGQEKDEQELENFRETLELFSQAAEGMGLFVNSMDEELFNKSKEKLITAAEDFYEYMKRIKDKFEGAQQEEIKCYRCGAMNTPGGMLCIKCKAVLPQSTELKSTEPVSTIDIKEGNELVADGHFEPQMTRNVNNLFELADGYSRGTIEKSQFVEYLDEMDKRLQEALSQIKGVPDITPELIEEKGEEKAQEFHDTLTRAADEYAEGVEKFAQGLIYFREFSESLSPKKSEDAKQILWDSLYDLQHSQMIIQKMEQ